MPVLKRRTLCARNQLDAALADLGVHLNVDIVALQEAAPSVIILAIKPQLAVDILASIALLAAPETLVISLMAGVSTGYDGDLLAVKRLLCAPCPTPLPPLAGMTAPLRVFRTQEYQKAAAEALLATVGQTVWSIWKKRLMRDGNLRLWPGLSV